MIYTLVLTPHQLAVILATLKHSPSPHEAVPVYIAIVKQLDLEEALGVVLGAKEPV